MIYQFHNLEAPEHITIERGKLFDFPVHLHQCFEIIFLRSGEMQLTIDGQPVTLTAGDAAMIFPHQIHSVQVARSEQLFCIFSPTLVQAFSSETANLLPQSNLFKTDDFLLQAVDNLNDQSTLFEKKGILYWLCSQFHKQATYRPRDKNNDDLLYKIFSFVEKEFSGDCTLASLASKTGYDYSYLSRFFKKNVGMSFNAYVNHVRLNHACYLMKNSRFSILSCALNSGYTSIRSFNYNFKQIFGIPPTRYRSEMQKQSTE